jgi:hypothetical protein
MKKIYATPSLVIRGNLVAETNAGSPNPGESSGETDKFPLSMIGSVGFYL